jgi:putative nucleotidyltransferase with HDIG domain
MKKILGYIRDNINAIMRFSLFAAAVVILLISFPKEGKFKYEFQRGKPWLHEDLYAPFDFPVNKTESELQEERERAIREVKPYFQLDPSVKEAQVKKLTSEFNRLWTEKYGNSGWTVDKKNTNLSFGVSILDSIYKKGILKPDPVIENKAPDFEVTLLISNTANDKQLNDFFTLQQASAVINGAISKAENIDKGLLPGLLLNHLAYDIIYDKEKTESELKRAIEGISLSKGMVQRGELIISRGRVVNSVDYQILLSLKENYENQYGTPKSFYSILIGQAILISISMLVLALFLRVYRKDIYADNKKILLILLLILVMVVTASMVVKYDVNYITLVPICMVPVMIRAFFDTRLALFVHLITIITAGFLVPNSFQFVFLQLLAGIVAIMSVKQMEHRAQFFYTALWIFLMYLATISGLTLIQGGRILEISPQLVINLAINATLILFAYPLIFILEKGFGIITDVTLIELSNSNNKLLRELAHRAPGTFQHSLQVANLSEEVMYEIGGNALLVRVGALYHDVGKMDMPQYFIENQVSGFNPHDELTYEESAQIIVNHVIKGVENAKKHKLPEEIIDFIRTHHGTRKVEYFYIKQRQDNPLEDVDENIFTYPGPKPFSRETAVVMMADSVEAASRSLPRPDEENINNLVEYIIDKQTETGQFSNANITLRDISRAKKILKNKLLNIYHARIAYPEVK